MKKVLSAALVLVMLISAVPVCAHADTNLYPSDAVVEFIKAKEGFAPTAYWDYSQWTIGYGTRAKDYQLAEDYIITEQEATDQLKQELAGIKKTVGQFLSDWGITLSQQQFDAVMSFCYNVGTGAIASKDQYGNWQLGSTIARYIANGAANYTDKQIADAFAAWSHAGGDFLPGLGMRRIQEAQIFLYGDYSTGADNRLCYLKVYPNGGTCESGNTVFAFVKGEPYGTLPSFTYNGVAEGLWIKKSDGKPLYPTDTVTDNQIGTIMWQGDLPDPDDPPPDEPNDPVVPQPTTDLPFVDIFCADWYYQSVHDMFAAGIIKGYPEDATFRPNNTITRAEFVTMLANFAKADCTCASRDVFSDVAPDAWYADTVGWASDIGIVSGYEDGTFKPNDAITREDMAAIIGRYLRFAGISLPAVKEAADFADSENISGYAYDDVCTMQRAGILSGYGENGVFLFKPKANATRAEVCTVLCNVADAMSKAAPTSADEVSAQIEVIPETEETVQAEDGSETAVTEL